MPSSALYQPDASMINHLKCDYCFASIDPEADTECIIPAPPRPCYPVFELILCPRCREERDLAEVGGSLTATGELPDLNKVPPDPGDAA
jgi:hypothetical protein